MTVQTEDQRRKSARAPTDLERNHGDGQRRPGPRSEGPGLACKKENWSWLHSTTARPSSCFSLQDGSFFPNICLFPVPLLTCLPACLCPCPAPSSPPRKRPL